MELKVNKAENKIKYVQMVRQNYVHIYVENKWKLINDSIKVFIFFLNYVFTSLLQFWRMGDKSFKKRYHNCIFQKLETLTGYWITWYAFIAFTILIFLHFNSNF